MGDGGNGHDRLFLSISVSDRYGSESSVFGEIPGEPRKIGVGIFQPLDWPEPEIAYSLDRPFWRQGFATEAAAVARGWLFRHFPVPRAASFI